MSPEDKHKAKFGEGGQADYLVAAKERNSETKQPRRSTRLWETEILMQLLMRSQQSWIRMSSHPSEKY